jgi:hypothetical protein
LGKLNGRRLRALEECLPPSAEALASWPIEDQVADTLAAFELWKISGPGTGSCTDRQLLLLAGAWALIQLGGVPGEFELPSGVTITWSEDAYGNPTVDASGPVTVEDLPEHVARYVYRMPRAAQPQHERLLHELAMERLARERNENDEE